MVTPQTFQYGPLLVTVADLGPQDPPYATGEGHVAYEVTVAGRDHEYSMMMYSFGTGEEHRLAQFAVQQLSEALQDPENWAGRSIRNRPRYEMDWFYKRAQDQVESALRFKSRALRSAAHQVAMETGEHSSWNPKDWNPPHPEAHQGGSMAGNKERKKDWAPRGERLIVRFEDDEHREAYHLPVHGRAEAEASARDTVLPQAKEALEIMLAHEKETGEIDGWDFEGLEEVVAVMEAREPTPREFEIALETWNSLVASHYGTTKVEIL